MVAKLIIFMLKRRDCCFQIAKNAGFEQGFAGDFAGDFAGASRGGFAGRGEPLLRLTQRNGR